MKKARPALSWRWKLTLLTSAFALAPLLSLAYWQLSTIEEERQAQMQASLEAIASSKATAIETLTANRRRDVERMATLLAPRLEVLLTAEAGVRELEPEPEEPEAPLPALQDAEALDPNTEPGTDDPEGPGEGPEVDPPPPVEPDPAVVEAGRRLQQAIEARDAADGALRRAVALILWDQAEFEELLLIQQSGVVRVATFSEHEQRDASEIAYFQGGLRATYVQPVFMSPITERLTMVISTPIRDSSAQVVGVLAARLNLSSLFEIIANTAGLGRTGETVVAKLLGEEVVFMAPTRHDPQAALQRRIPIGEDTALPIQEAARGLVGSDLTRDYRGHEVIAAWAPIPSLGWGLVVKQDVSEAMAPAEALQMRTLQIAAVLLFLAVIASLLFARELVRPLAQLKDATERISRGDLDVRIDDLRSRDEIGQLADSFERMVAAIKFFRAHARSAEEEEELGLEEDDAIDEAPREEDAKR